MIVLIVAAILIISNLYASTGGVDFTWRNHAMTSQEFYSNYQIPEFENVQHATIWAYKTKWQEPIRRLLHHRMDELLSLASPHANNLDPAELKITAYYMSQWDDCRVALKIIEEYKAINMQGDWSMTARETELSIPYFKTVNDAQIWANSKNFEPKLFRLLKNKMMNIEIHALQNYRASDKQAMKRMKDAIDQYEAVSLAVLIFKQHRSHGKIGNNAMMTPGASFIASSTPIIKRNK